MKKVVICLTVVVLGLGTFLAYRAVEARLVTVQPSYGQEFLVTDSDDYLTVYLDQGPVDIHYDDMALRRVSPGVPEYLKFVRLQGNEMFILGVGLHPGH